MEESFYHESVVLIKPHAVKRGIVGEITTRFEKVGLKLTAMKMIWVNKGHVAKHYKDEKDYLTNIGERTLEDYKKFGFDSNETLGTSSAYKIGQKVRRWNVESLSEGPLIAMLWKGVNAVEIIRKMIGATNISQALPGTIRGDFSNDTPVLATLQKRPINTLVHASGTLEEAKFERKLWFKESEIYKY